MPKCTYDRSAEHHMLDAFGLELNESGHVMFEDGGYVKTYCGEESARIDKVGGFIHDDEGDVLLIHDDFLCMSEYVSDNEA